MKIVGIVFSFLVDAYIAFLAIKLAFKDDPTLKDIAPMIGLLVVMAIVNEWKLIGLQNKLEDNDNSNHSA